MEQRTSNTDAPGALDRPEPGCCTVSHDLTADHVATDVETFATLGNDTRYEALRYIEAADQPVCVCELEPVLGVSQGAVSQALSRLFSAGLVDKRKEGRWRYYSATDRAERILAVVDETRLADD